MLVISYSIDLAGAVRLERGEKPGEGIRDQRGSRVPPWHDQQTSLWLLQPARPTASKHELSALATPYVSCYFPTANFAHKHRPTPAVWRGYSKRTCRKHPWPKSCYQPSCRFSASLRHPCSAVTTQCNYTVRIVLHRLCKPPLTRRCRAKIMADSPVRCP